MDTPTRRWQASAVLGDRPRMGYAMKLKSGWPVIVLLCLFASIAHAAGLKVYRGDSTGYSNLIARVEGGYASAAAAAAFLLLL